MERYKKNILVKGIGEEGQKKLLRSKVAVVGIGGLGSAVSLYLSAAGIGELILVDNDTVDLNNLQRQILYDENSIGLPKTQAAKNRLKSLNSGIKIIPMNLSWKDAAAKLINAKTDIIVDCVDNMETKFDLNDFAILSNTPLVHSGVVSMQGQITTIIPGKTGCLRCLFPDKIPDNTSSDIFGILGPVAGNMGALQAIEVIKHITGAGKCLSNMILFIDYAENNFKTIKYEKNTDCSCSRVNIHKRGSSK
ncbi:HesA/MoeB/ThiF family protein [bacterium]|nr:HesA/MoeB/ThiF family protein [Candidatus Omnitrophota bacterium]MBU2527940.1 HesA/MoeB/ThiF family protein [bacterium]MBU3929294.1 HesA/MoeB/ThiF family protein [bacterium]MBU4122283.1 HesA/MoeB/ThiF family protein [bacterium]